MIAVELGAKFGRLTLIRHLDQRDAEARRLGIWSCDCGKETTAALSRVKGGSPASCGCLSRQGRAPIHGMRSTPEYSTWRAMKSRCLNPAAKDYPRYGARGISLHPEWAASFSSFLEHVGPRPAGTTLDRIDPRGGYVPGNVRWATPLQQARNRQDLVEIVTENGERMPLVDFAARIGITKGAAHLRLKRRTLKGVVYES